MDLTWVLMVRTTKETNSLNYCNVKFVKLLKNLGVIHIVANTSQTPIVGSIDCQIPSSISCGVKNSLELQDVANIIWKITRSS